MTLLPFDGSKLTIPVSVVTGEKYDAMSIPAVFPAPIVTWTNSGAYFERH